MPSGEYLQLPKLFEPIDVLDGIFLRRVFFLNEHYSKSVTIGIFKNRNYSLGVMFKGKHDYIYWTFDMFNQFYVNFNIVSKALLENKMLNLNIDENSVKVLTVYEIPHVFINSGDNTLTLNAEEWSQFVSILPQVQLELRELFYEEDLIKQFLCGGSNSLSPFILNRLVVEIAKSNGGCN